MTLGLETVGIAHIHARDISDAWFRACAVVMQRGHDYRIERGSYAGQRRRQLLGLGLCIERPELRPLFDAGNRAPVADDASTERYFRQYLIGDKKAEKEQYTYAERIEPQLPGIVEMLIATPHTNQAAISVAQPDDFYLPDPPCLRSLQWTVMDGRLCLHSYWRSWDVYNALPINAGGLQLLNEHVASFAGLDTGWLIAYSSGAHIYEHAWSMVDWWQT